MQKEGKTARELEDMIAARIGVGGVQVAVFKSPQLGWDANVLVFPQQAQNAKALCDKVTRELRGKYDLKEAAN